MQRSQWKPLQEEERTQETLARIRARRKEIDRNLEQSNNYLIQKQTLEERKGKLEQVIFKQAQDLNELEEKKLRAEKSLNLMQTNWNKKKIEINDNNPHLAQL